MVETSNAQMIGPMPEARAPVKILLVPGHDDENWGAQYGNLKEAAMNLALATRIYNILKQDSRFDVYITRNSLGYTKEFADYFTDHRADIISFKENAKIENQNNIANGSFVEIENAPHVTVSQDIADRLYGFNKWANENNMDAVIHVHFNDYPRVNRWTAGKYRGFAIYMPERQMVNSTESARLAAFIYLKLKEKYITSTYKRESGGLIPDQKLIALGANGTLLPSVRSVLIEYGYIYRFGNNLERQNHYTNMANLTAQGIKNYFFGK